MPSSPAGFNPASMAFCATQTAERISSKVPARLPRKASPASSKMSFLMSASFINVKAGGFAVEAGLEDCAKLCLKMPAKRSMVNIFFMVGWINLQFNVDFIVRG